MVRVPTAAAVLSTLFPLLAVAQESQVSARGFSPERAFAVADVDSVSLFNGNLTLTIPIGSTYPVGGDLSYGLTLVYNSLVWDLEKDFDGEDEVTRPVASAISNAGLGWTLTLGMLVPADTPPFNDTDFVVYVSPDGAKHHFYPELHEGDDDGATNTSYTRDNSYLRMTDLDATTREIEFPDSTIHTFTDHDAGPDENWRLDEIRDRFNNDLAITYSAPGATWTWTLTDKQGRQQTIDFVENTVLPFGYIVDSVTLTTFSGNPAAVYEFQYQEQLVEKCYRDTDPAPDTSILAPLLTQIVLPDGSAWDITDSAGDPRYHTTGCADGTNPGSILGLRLPTRGQIEWGYGTYRMPNADQMFRLTLVSGVRERRMLDAAGNTLGTWLYGSLPFPPPPYDEFTQPEETRTHVVTPDDHCTTTFFSANPNSGFSNWPYGLPFSETETDGSFFVSTETWDSHETDDTFPVDQIEVCAGNLLRTTSVTYEHDPFGPSMGDDNLHLYNTNRRLNGRRTRYHDDADRFADTELCDFDGLGHYREVTTNGDFGSANQRTTFTGYNPDQGTYNPNNDPDCPADSFTMLPGTTKWVTETFTERTVTEGGQTARETFCFEGEGTANPTGFLERRRTITSGTNEDSEDLLAVFTRGSAGNLTNEQFYGGDTQSIGTSSDLCSLGLPGNDVYHLRHNYQNGVRRRTRYVDAAGTDLSFLLVDRDIDLDTGLVSASRDTATLETVFEYDELGRLTQSEPESGHGARTEYVYTAAAGTNPASVEITQRQNGGGTILARQIIEFDGFGRVAAEKRRLPDGTFNVRETQYDAQGRKIAVSELEPESPGPTNFTEFLDYDAFDRPGRILAPDGHEVLLDYTGVSKVERTVTVTRIDGVEDPSTTTEELDRQGRLWKVTEPAGVSGEGVTTTYGYDEGNRLSSVAMDDGTTTQQRFFTYDNRGFLASEQHPEKGATGNGTVTFDDYDARGHAGRKTDGSNDLRFLYDRAERLTAIERLSDGRPEKDFAYASDNDPPNDYRLGKLQHATRHNHLSAFSNADVAIREVFTYGGIGGRISERQTQRSDNGAPFDPFFESEYAWTELGDVADLTYPSCVIAQDGECTGNPGPSLTITHTYTNAFLTAMPGWASSIGYHPNEMLASVVHANGVTDLWDEDPDAMRRPARIRTDGVSGGTDFDTGTYLYDGAGNVKAMGADSFGYDRVSRLIIGTASQGQLLETNEYDAFGNRIAATTSNVGSRSIPTDPATNRLLGTADRPVTYDDRGNVVQWGTAVYERDPFDMIVRHDDGSLDLTYVYTADDERIITVVHPPSAVSESWTLRDLDGKVLRRFFRSPSVDATWQKDTIHRQGQVLATEDGAGRRDAHLDHLGTIRLWTGPGGGSPTHHTYHAFGEEVLDVQDGQVLRFTGHERDIYRSGGCSGTTVIDGQTLDEGETFVGCDEITSENTTVTSSEEVRFKAGDRVSLGNDFGVVPGAVFTAELDGYLNSDLQDLDYMHARYYSPGMGRFLSIDKADDTDLVRPQTWNEYTYARNNPLKFVDPDGLEVQVLDQGALGLIRATLPESLRSAVQLTKGGMINKETINAVKTVNANFNDLAKLVSSAETVEVATGTEVAGEEFIFESQASLQAAFPDQADQITGPNSFLGQFQTPSETASGMARVTVSNQTGKAATAFSSHLARTMAHELFGHALFFVSGVPYLHGDPGVDEAIAEIEQRTFEEEPE